jgi:hypothetical protein
MRQYFTPSIFFFIKLMQTTLSEAVTADILGTALLLDSVAGSLDRLLIFT